MLDLIGYVRVSTDIQKERESIHIQTLQIERFCKGQGFKLLKIYKDEGVSGTVPFSKRIGGSGVLSSIEEGKVDGVVFTKLDRAFRNASDALLTIDNWHRKNTALFILNFMNGNRLDSRDPISKAMLSLVSVFSQLERDMIAERVRESQKVRKETLQRYCKSVYGFDVVDNKLVPNPREQQGLSLIHYLRTQGYSLQVIADELTLQEFKPPRNHQRWYKSTIQKILSNPIQQVQNQKVTI